MGSMDVAAAAAGLRIRFVTGHARFDRPTPIRRLATATLRGLCGTALLNSDPATLERLFKPGAHGSQPPAFLFQPLHRSFHFCDQFTFRLVTWDPLDELRPAFQKAIENYAPAPFGTSGAYLLGIEWTLPQSFAFESAGFGSPCLDIQFVTPLRLAHGKHWFGPDTLSLSPLANCLVQRVNQLSEFYGNGRQLDPYPFCQHAGICQEIKRDLRVACPRRQSSTQDTYINLAGITGHWMLAGVERPLVDLLALGAVIHAGKNTSDGCGLIQTQPPR